MVRGEIRYVNLEPVVGSELGKNRPCLIVTNDTANRFSPVITVVTLTSKAPSKPYPFYVEISDVVNMPQKSWANCSYIRTVDKSRVGPYFASVDDLTLRRVSRALVAQLDL